MYSGMRRVRPPLPVQALHRGIDMGFNPRLAPYTITYQQNPFQNTSATYDVDWFKFPFAGELLAAYGAVQSNVVTDATTAMTTLAIGKSAAGTGAYASVSSRVVTAGSDGASTWDNLTQYTLANHSAVANRQFAAGDWAMIRIIQVNTSGGPNYLNVQMDYVIGHEAGTTASAGTGPA